MRQTPRAVSKVNTSKTEGLGLFSFCTCGTDVLTSVGCKGFLLVHTVAFYNFIVFFFNSLVWGKPYVLGSLIVQP